MEENKNIVENKFTDDEIMETIIKLAPEDKSALLTIEFNTIRTIANNPKYGIDFMRYCADMSKAYENICKAVVVFNSALKDTDKSTEHVMNKMVENYKSFSNEERLKFSEQIMDMNDVEVSTDLFKSTWRKFINHLDELVKGNTK